MNMKPYVLRGKTSPEWTAYDYGVDYRSAQRGYAPGRASPYKSEFDLDGSIHRRSTFYSPPRLSPRSSRAYLAAKAAALGQPRSGGVSEWSRESGSPSMPQSRDMSPDISTLRSSRGSDVDGPQVHGGHRERGGGGGGLVSKNTSAADESRHRELKRKMVFDLHKEINKSAHTTHLEEISDMDKITDICFSNLRVMMENKKHRKYLHHMNNNALTMSSLLLKKLEMNMQNFTNNSHLNEARFSRNAKRMAMDGTLARKASLKPSEMIQAVSPINPLKVRGPKMALKTGKNLKQRNSTVETVPARTPTIPTQIKTEINREDSTLTFLAELEDQIENSKKEAKKIPAAKTVPLMTPEEVLACHYLRLNQDQVARLEKCIREKGQDPGIHVHMDVHDYDVFSEIRRMRQTQKTAVEFEYKEEEEEETGSQQKENTEASRKK